VTDVAENDKKEQAVACSFLCEKIPSCNRAYLMIKYNLTC
jgi:hypothetical protein